MDENWLVLSSMDNPGSSLSRLRTVEFRSALRGYHPDDVDEFLDEVANEVEELQQRLHQLEDELASKSEHPVEQGNGSTETMVLQARRSEDEEALRRTLEMAQRFVEHAKNEAETQAAELLRQAEARAHSLIDDAEKQARQVVADAERGVRDEVVRLEAAKTNLVHEVESLNKYLESERSRMRTFVRELARWFDEHLKPTELPPGLKEKQSPSSGGEPALRAVPSSDPGTNDRGRQVSEQVRIIGTVGQDRLTNDPGI